MKKKRTKVVNAGLIRDSNLLMRHGNAFTYINVIAGILPIRVINNPPCICLSICTITTRIYAICYFWDCFWDRCGGFYSVRFGIRGNKLELKYFDTSKLMRLLFYIKSTSCNNNESIFLGHLKRSKYWFDLYHFHKFMYYSLISSCSGKLLQR